MCDTDANMDSLSGQKGLAVRGEGAFGTRNGIRFLWLLTLWFRGGFGYSYTSKARCGAPAFDCVLLCFI